MTICPKCGYEGGTFTAEVGITGYGFLIYDGASGKEKIELMDSDVSDDYIAFICDACCQDIEGEPGEHWKED